MNKSAFISYASQDVYQAQEVCSLLEKAGLKLWIAPRDLVPGENYPEEIVKGIESSACLVLLLSEHSNNSSFVCAEVERAYSKKKPIFPFRISNVAPSPRLELLISTQHWIDGWNDKFDTGIQQLADAVYEASRADESVNSGGLRKQLRRALWIRITPKRAVALTTIAFTITLSAIAVILWALIGYKGQVPAYIADTRVRILSSILLMADDSVFRESQNGKYEIVRFLSGGKDLAANTQIATDMRLSQRSFDLMANQGFFLKDQIKTLEELLSKGVLIRIILIDHTEPNIANTRSFYSATENTSDVARLDNTVLTALGYERNLWTYFEPLQKRYPGLLQIRFSRKQLLYTMWIRDAKSESHRACHLGVQFYGGNESNPYFRGSSNTGKALVDSLSKQFELLWSQGIERSL